MSTTLAIAALVGCQAQEGENGIRGGTELSPSEDYSQPVQTKESTELSRSDGDTWKVKPGSVHDGDTFRAIRGAEEIKVRIACIDAPELKQPGGIEARDFLREMLPDNQPIILAIAEEDRFGRKVAEVYALTDQPGLEVGVNGEMVAAGYAHFFERFKSACPDNAQLYAELEERAIATKAGVWSSGNAERPWDWRKRNR